MRLEALVYGVHSFPLPNTYNAQKHPRIAIIGEAVHADDMKAGQLYFSEAGKLLRGALVDGGIDIDDCIFLNACMCVPRPGAQPNAEQIKACRPYLHQQLHAIQPKVILAMGAIAIKSLFNLRGTVVMKKFVQTAMQYNNVPVFNMYHPAYLLRRMKHSVIPIALEENYKKAINSAYQCIYGGKKDGQEK